jgi:UDP-glucose 4-epimerase
VCDELTQAGYQVIIYDKDVSRWKRPEQIMMQGSILDQNSLDMAVKNCAAVYNFAAISDLNEALSKPLRTVEVNILGNAMALEACRKNAVKRYLYASTVYVESREGGFYRCSKKAAEDYVEGYQHMYGLDYTILRYGSLYGPRSDVKNGLWRIVKSALETGKVCYQGSPEAMREYIHVQDAAIASVRALDKDFLNQLVVLTGQEPMRVLDLLKMLSEILGIKQPVEFEDYDLAGHYIRTPYSYENKIGRKYISPMHVDLGQGLLQLIRQIDQGLD